MALHGHPRPLVLAPIESAYAISIVTLVLSCPVSEIYKSLFTETYGSKIDRRTDIYTKKKEMREYNHAHVNTQLETQNEPTKLIARTFLMTKLLLDNNFRSKDLCL